MSLLLALCAPALAGDIVALVEISSDGPRLVDALLLGRGAPESLEGGPVLGQLIVQDASGAALAAAPLLDPRHRSVILPEGGGLSATLDRAYARVFLPWPEGAEVLTLGEQRLRPHAPPPGEPIPLIESGPADQRLDVLFLGDGYTEDELDDFAADVDRMVAFLLTVDPYGAYSTLFNVWRVDTPSAESGASHYEDSPRLERDTYYDCYYGCGGIERLTCCDDATVMAEVNGSLPDADGIVVLINDEEYGGSGGWQYATSYTADPWGEYVFAHELGHTFVGLWDEYSYGTTGRGEGPNCAADSSGGAWSEWLGEGQVDAFPVCSYTNLYRPTDSACMMNILQDDYCPVCREQAVLALYGRLPGLIEATSHPEGALSLSEETLLEVTELGPSSGALERTWTLDGELLSEEASLSLAACGPSGELVYTTHDPTPWVRDDPSALLSDSARWDLVREPCPTGDSVDSGPSSDDSGGSGDDGPKACGCSAGGAGSPLLVMLGIVAILLRRRLH